VASLASWTGHVNISDHSVPVRDTNGNLYIAQRSANGEDIEMFKSTDNGSNWSEVDAAGVPSLGPELINTFSMVGWESGGDTKIGVIVVSTVYTSGMDSFLDVEFSEFHCSDVATTGDTWNTVNNTIDTPTNAATFSSPQCGIERRSGDYMVVYPGDFRATMGNDYSTAWYGYGTNASWTVARFDAMTAATHAQNMTSAPSSQAGDAHMFAAAGSADATLNAANNKSTGVNGPTLLNTSPKTNLFQTSSSVNAVVGGQKSGTTMVIYVIEEAAVTDDITATVATVQPFDMVTEDGTEIGPFVVHDATNSKVWALWLDSNEATNTVFGISAPDDEAETEASWDSSATSFVVDAALEATSLDRLYAGIWDDGGSTWLGIFNCDTSADTVDFWRYELASGGLAITPAVASVAITAGGLTITTGSVPITPAVASVSATPASLTVTQASPIDPVGASVGVTPSTLVVTPGSVGVTPAPLTVSVTPSTVVLTTTVDVTLVAASVSATPSTVAVTTETPLTLTGQSVAITPGTLDVVGAQAVDPVGASVSISAGGLVLTTQTPITLAAQAVTVTPGSVVLDQNVVLTGASVSVTPDSLTVTTGAVNITPTAPTVTITPGTLDVTAALSVSLVGQTVTVTPSTLEVDTAITPATAAVIVTAGGLTVAQSVTLPAPVVAVTPGTVDVTVGAAPVDPVGQTVNVSAGSMTITVGAVDITPAPVTVSVTPSTLAVTTETAVTPAPVTVNVTAGSLELDHGINIGGQTVNASPSTLVVAAGLPLEPTGQTVTVTSGTMTVTTGSVNISLDAATVAVTPSTVQVANAGEEEAGMLMMMGIGT
jgi:hypothetical protein